MNTTTQPKEIAMSAERAVQVHEQPQPPAAAEPASILAVITRAAADPTIDPERLERYLAMYERLDANRAEVAFDQAMNACQEAMRPIATDANNPQTKSRYASYAALDRALRPIYSAHGFSVSFDTAEGAPQDHIRLVARVAHRDGHKVSPHLDMPADGKGAKGGDVMTKTHAIGAAVTYGRRYLLGMIFNIAVGEDDDGNSNGGREFGPVAKRAIETLNGHKTAAEHLAWKQNHAEGVEKLVEPWEWKEIVALWNRRAKVLKERAQPGGQQADASDFPGDRR